MEPIVYIDRKSGKEEHEKVYGARALQFLYGNDFLSQIFGAPLLHLLSRYPVFSALYGFWQRLPFTRKKIKPFIKNFDLDEAEFLENPETFRSFNDFFIRKLKESSRPLELQNDRAIIPADGRYWFYQKISTAQYFNVKGEMLDLSSLLEDDSLAKHYQDGAMVLARLCPSDYHRFHFPCDCIPGKTRLINGWLYSVNPIALKKDIQIFTKNKRTLCILESEVFGKVLYLEVGATAVGSIHETYTSGRFTRKGEEKGYFSFGASSLVLLFEPGRICFDSDLLAATANNCEIRCLMGQSMGKSYPHCAG